MQITNPLVPAQNSGTPSLVANAPSAPDNTRHETSRPVTGSSEGERSRSDSGRPKGDSGGSDRRGGRVDIAA